MPISCYDEEASAFEDGTVASRSSNCYDDETGEWVGQKSGLGYSNQSYDDGDKSVMWAERNRGTWIDEDGNEVSGAQWNGAVADVEVMLSGDPNSTDIGSYYGVDGKLLGAEAECIQSEGEQSVSVQTTVAEGGVQWGTTGTDQDTHNRVAISAGDGQAVRLHDSDRDHDGRPEWGLGFDIGPVAVDQTSEDPLGTVYDEWFSGFGDMTDEDENLTESVFGPPPSVQRGAPKSFDEMDSTELTLSALFNDGMKPERRREILGGQVEAISNLFGGAY